VTDEAAFDYRRVDREQVVRRGDPGGALTRV
jgi:hypothetical protein